MNDGVVDAGACLCTYSTGGGAGGDGVMEMVISSGVADVVGESTRLTRLYIQLGRTGGRDPGRDLYLPT